MKKPIIQKKSLEEQLADLVMPNDPPDFEEALCEPKVEELYERLCRQISGSHTKHPSETHFERIQLALPEDMKKELVKYDDMWGNREAIAREAGYLVGFALGRRMAGGAR